MFTSTELRNLKSKYKEDLVELLNKLDLTDISATLTSVIEEDGKDEFQSYDDYYELDSKITLKVCDNLKSDSIIDGYTKLLKIGKVTFNYDETDNELLNKIIENKQRIIDGNVDILEQAKLQALMPQSQVEQKSIDKSEEIFMSLSLLNKYSHFSLKKKFNDFYDFIRPILDKFKISKKVEDSIKNLRFTIDLSDNFLIKGERIKIDSINDIEEIIKEQLSRKNYGEPVSICIEARKLPQTIKTEPEPVKPTPPPVKEPPFTQEELEKVFDLLETINKIVKTI